MTAKELPPNLAPRLVTCLRLVAQGKTFIEIGEAMNIAPTTARNYCDALRDKFQVERKRDLIGEAYRFGFMDGDGKPQRKTFDDIWRAVDAALAGSPVVPEQEQLR
jgi:DNA-binding CsgD family transcriptional regulator